MKTAVIVGAAPLGKEKEKLKELLNNGNVYSIAADGGINFFLENNICPDHFIGDMDSNNLSDRVKAEFPGLKTDTCSPIKDVTDMEIGVVDAVNKGCHNILLYGGIGGKRISHTIANVQLISFYKDRGTDIRLVGSDCEIYLIGTGEKVEYPKDKKGYISVFSLTDISRDVNIEGLFYEYKGDLYNNKALGVSNEFTGKKASISVNEGQLLIIEETDR